MKNEKKVEKTKATLVREVEVKFKVNKGFFDSLERANKETIVKKPGEHIFITLEAIHRVQNPGQKPVKIMEAQVGSILKETDIVRFQDVYGRVSKK